ncbi:uncharacterized protein LOC114928388 [Nylanderia fulva]|uniref:uncharacterized protein LOC114928388 n=1 Tax=Nylanderia fulva TaxID=613905 RepID=UPI0010FB0A8D|nr:uncharacterized protein LOC114928388 [Nylanderia fulva]
MRQKKKFHKAVNNFVFNNEPLEDAARNNGIDDLLTLLKESVKCLRLKLNKEIYTYDKLSEKNGVFTFNEESLLLKELKAWEKRQESPCICQVCAMQQPRSIAYNLAQQNEKCPQIWKNNKANLSWLYNFIIKYTEEISKFKTAKECKIDNASPTDSKSPSLTEEEVSDPHTTLSDLSEYSGPSPVINIKERERREMRIKIEEHLKVNAKLNIAAKKVLANVLVKKANIEKIAKKYDLNHSLLTSKINILKWKTKTFEKKLKYESAINYIIFNETSTSIAARKYNADEVTLTMELSEWRKSKSGTYVYDALTVDNTGIFTFSEEFVLLKQLLRLHPGNLDQNCNCQICVLEHLSKLAYNFAKELHKKCPFQWNKHEKADVTWLLEFEMRYSKEIADNTDSKCKASEKTGYVE